jgi:hypothetical protein
VIYGSNTIAGQVFGDYLRVNYGFNLILISSAVGSNDATHPPRQLHPTFEQDSLSSPALHQGIRTLTIDRFDEKTLQRSLLDLKTLPVKLFINCANLRRGRSDDMFSSMDVEMQGKRNMEGYAALISEFLPQMVQSTMHPAVVNVDNEVPEDTDIFF